VSGTHRRATAQAWGAGQDFALFVLHVTRGPDKGKQLPLEAGKTYTIGCDAESQLVLTDPLVLKGHCSLEVGQDAVILRNHTATAGTFVGSHKISQAKLKANSLFRIGDSVLAIVAAPPAAPKPKPRGPDAFVGRIIGGYKLIEVVGEGGMGKVYRATQLSLHRDVALKVLRDELAKDTAFRDLFVNEARAAAQLVHPNVVQVYDAGSEGDLVFFSMEFLGGGSVEEILAREKKIPWQTAILQVLEAAHGLDYAEGRGIVHRDIKPDNLMINGDGRVKIADLGLAKRGEGAQQKGIIGTPHFIPPEQALGKEVDTRADIYSLGATFFRMITGRTLFTGKTAKEIVLKHIKEPPPAASSIDSDIPDEIDLVLAKMLAKEPGRRYQTAKELIAALEEICAAHGIKGAIIRKGVGKRVLIPLFVLLAGAAAAIYFLAIRPAETFVPPEVIKAQKEAERLQREAEERAKQAARDRRKTEAANELLTRERSYDKLRLDIPFQDVYDVEDETKADENEQRWLELAKNFEDFAESKLAQDFDAELEVATKAQKYADDIREDLRQWKESTVDRKQKREAKLKEAKEIDSTLRSRLAEMRANRHYEEAWNLCDLVATGKPPKEDPFAPITGWEWVNPVNPELRAAAMKFADIKEVVEASQKYFKDEAPRIIEEAVTAGNAVVERAKALPDEAAKPVIDAMIKELQGVRSFIDGDVRQKVKAIQDLVSEARQQQTRLENILKTRALLRLKEDRLAVRDTQRRYCSLDHEQQPNSLMDCDFPAVIDAWNRMLVNGKIETPLYQRFAKERIEMLRWCDYLFARFHADVVSTAKGVDKVLSTLEVDRVPFSDRELTGADLSSKGAERYKFAITKYYSGESAFAYDRFPMDWIYNSLFLYRNEPRWKEVTPEIEFALGAFCFESMQYGGAVRHFEAVLKIDNEAVQKKYGPAARMLLERAAREDEARREWEAICREAETAPTVDALMALSKRVQEFPQKYEGTMFYLDVMDRRDEPQKDFYSADYPEIPSPPAPPEPIDK